MLATGSPDGPPPPPGPPNRPVGAPLPGLPTRPICTGVHARRRRPLRRHRRRSRLPPARRPSSWARHACRSPAATHPVRAARRAARARPRPARACARKRGSYSATGPSTSRSPAIRRGNARGSCTRATARLLLWERSSPRVRPPVRCWDGREAAVPTLRCMDRSSGGARRSLLLPGRSASWVGTVPRPGRRSVASNPGSLGQRARRALRLCGDGAIISRATQEGRDAPLRLKWGPALPRGPAGVL